MHLLPCPLTAWWVLSACVPWCSRQPIVLPPPFLYPALDTSFPLPSSWHLLSSTQLLTPPFLYPALDTSFPLPSSWHLLSSTQLLTPPFLYPALDTSFPLPSSWHLLSSTQLLTPPFLYPALDTSFPLPSSWHLLSSTQLLTPPFLYPALDTSFPLPSSWHLLSSTQLLTPPFLYPALDTSFPLPSSWHLLSSTQLLTLSGSVFSRCSVTIKWAGSSNISQPLIHFGTHWSSSCTTNSLKYFFLLSFSELLFVWVLRYTVGAHLTCMQTCDILASLSLTSLEVLCVSCASISFQSMTSSTLITAYACCAFPINCAPVTPPTGPQVPRRQPSLARMSSDMPRYRPVQIA